MVVVDKVILHGGLAHRAIGAIVIDAGGGVSGSKGAVVQAEPFHLFMAPGKAGWKGIVGVEASVPCPDGWPGRMASYTHSGWPFRVS